MSDSGEVSLLTLIDRLAKLEGMLIGLQNSIVQGQSQTSAFMARVERLEHRQLELEKSGVTKADLRELSDKVDGLIASEAAQRGSAGLARWSTSQAINLAAVVIALLALLGVATNRDRINASDADQLPFPLTTPTEPR